MDRPPTTKIDEAKFAGFWIRVGAHFVDWAVLLIPWLLIQFLVRSIIPHPWYRPVEEYEAQIRILSSICGILMMWMYYAVLHSSKWQASIGKKVLGLKVVDRNGNRISFGRATGRFFAWMLSFLILGIGFMMIGWTKRKQGLHDIIADTYIIRSEEA
jgi:uncharacterized RDD family membrane protein YckC